MNVFDAAREYVEYEINDQYKSIVKELIQTNNINQLNKLFIPRISFGTAGLRGLMSPGYHNINSLIIIQTTQGLIRYMYELYGTEYVQQHGIVIGYDGRHQSHSWNNLVINICLLQNINVYYFNSYCCTPFVPYYILQVHAVCGVMITASHNPATDNGYKLYANNGCQIIAPHDSNISKSIQLNLKPWYQYTTELQDVNNRLLHESFDDCMTLYMQHAVNLSCSSKYNAQSRLRIAYTAMHGVGQIFIDIATAAFNLPKFVTTPQQSSVDPDFPTVKFPNPEEGKGALKLAIETAESNNCTLILANDPDADRLAVAELQPDGSWYIMNGNEIAMLFADHAWNQYKQANSNISDYSHVYMCNSTVSSKFIRSMAQHEGFNYIDTLTGFKWIGNKVSDLVSDGNIVLFAYEVEIGFLNGTLSYDKDGVRAACVFAELANKLLQHNKSCVEHIQSLYEKYAYFAGTQSYYMVHDKQHSTDIFRRLRNYNNNNNTPNTHTDNDTNTVRHNYPQRCGNYTIKAIRDVTNGIDTSDSQHKLPQDSSSEMITFMFDNQAVCTLRNSGTEPKLKYYIEVSGDTHSQAHTLLQEMTEYVINEFIQPAKYGLIAKQ